MLWTDSSTESLHRPRLHCDDDGGGDGAEIACWRPWIGWPPMRKAPTIGRTTFFLSELCVHRPCIGTHNQEMVWVGDGRSRTRFDSVSSDAASMSNIQQVGTMYYTDTVARIKTPILLICV